MKAKTIKAVLTKKFKEFCESIKDESLHKAVAENTIITGGSIASMLLREKVNDFDLYFRSKDVVRRVADYYVNQFSQTPPPKFKDGEAKLQINVVEEDERVRIRVKSAGVASESINNGYQYFEMAPDPESTAAGEYVDQAMKVVAEAETKDKPPYRPIFLTDNAITLADKVQLVIRFYGEPDRIHENYDFVHCTNYWTSWDGKLKLRPKALEALLARELRYIGSKYPLCSLIRTRKFVARNWTINAGQFLKMCWQLNQLDLTDLTVLEDQLTGVDTAYFMEVIKRLHERDKDRVDATYLMEIVDRIF